MSDLQDLFAHMSRYLVTYDYCLAPTMCSIFDPICQSDMCTVEILCHQWFLQSSSHVFNIECVSYVYCTISFFEKQMLFRVHTLGFLLCIDSVFGMQSDSINIPMVLLPNGKCRINFVEIPLRLWTVFGLGGGGICGGDLFVLDMSYFSLSSGSSYHSIWRYSSMLVQLSSSG